MAFIPTPHCARLVLNFRIGLFDWSNVMHCTKTDYTEAEMQDLADDMDTYLGTELAGYLNDVTYVGVTAYDIRTSDGPVYVANAASGTGTAGAGDTISPALAIVVTTRTAARGRSGRGRQYLSGFAEGSIEDGIWSAAAVGGAGTYIAARKAVIENAGFTWVVRSTQQDGTLLTTAVTRAITSYEVRSNAPGTQRRRIDRP